VRADAAKRNRTDAARETDTAGVSAAAAAAAIVTDYCSCCTITNFDCDIRFGIFGWVKRIFEESNSKQSNNQSF
jgi:hypothetical protein